MALSLLAPEAQMVLLSAAGREHDARLRRLLRAKLDWDLVTAIATREGASAILWARLKAVCGGEPLPEGVRELRALAMYSEFRQRFIEQRLGETLEVLSEAQLRVVLLKGVALGLTVYGSVARRPMGDIDLLVEPARAGAAQRLLLTRGWRESRFAARERFYSGHHHLPPLDDAGGTGIELELHTDLFFRGHPFAPLAELVRDEAEALPGRAPTIRVPRLSHHLLYLCLHFGWSHLFAAGAWRTFRDVEAIRASGEVDWEEFVEAARRTRGVTCCYWTLRLARNLLEIEVPAEVLEALHPRLSEVVLSMLERHLVSQLLPTVSLCPSLHLSYRAWGLAVRPEWSGHGGVRPWDRNPHFQGEAAATEEKRSDKLLSHLRNARGWSRYLAAVLSPRRFPATPAPGPR